MENCSFGRRGDAVVYMSMAGHRCAAEVRARRAGGTVDVDVDAGSGDHVQLTRIEFVPAAELRPGTCCAWEGA